MQAPDPIHTFLPSNVQALLARIPLFAEANDLRIAPLEGVISLNNTNYRVTVGERDYLLRVAADTARFLGVRREEEIEAARAAAAVGVGPEILYAEPQGHMVMAFIHGRHWQPEEFHEEANIRRIAETLRRLHSVTNVRAEGSVYRRIERLLDSARSLSLELPSELDALLETLSRIEASRRADTRFPPGLSHNDFWGNNFLDDGNQLWLVDWEFSGSGDGLHDLATIAMGMRYSEVEQTLLLTTYGYTDPGDPERLQSLFYVVRFFEAAWALVMHGLGVASDFDYQAHARRMFDALQG